MGISPGAADRVLTVDQSCPTFSWAGIDGADGYDLEVFTTFGDDDAPLSTDPADRAVGSLVLEVELPAGASSWTPSVDRCLAPGGTYVWLVQAVADGRPGGWSEGHYFRVSPRPSADEVALAFEILQRYLETGGEEGAEIPPLSTAGRPDISTPSSSSASSAARSSASVLGGSGMELEVDGPVQSRGLDIVSFVPQYLGRILADGDIATPSGIIETNRVALTAGAGLGERVSLHSPTVGKAVLCEAGTACETGSGADGTLFTQLLRAEGGIDVGPGGLTVIRAGFFNGTGGAGYFEVPSVTEVNVDNNASMCPDGAIVVAVRLWETDSNQVGVQVQCSQP
ncbi:MAG: hypothetical protein P8Y44_00380 [Acidobacteriota bacterium]